MTEEFDKEIDTLLRQAAQSIDTVSETQNLHLDADEINAFAQNALPAKARLRTMEHLADCSRCRKILSDVIAFHSETKSEIVPLIETKTFTAAPWYKRLFIFPQIAYVMGALALIFTGIIAIAILQNSGGKNSSEIAQIEDKNFSETDPSAESLNRADTNSSSNSAMSSNTSTGLAYSSNANMSAAPAAEASKNKDTSSPTPSATTEADAPADRAADDKPAKPEAKPTTTVNEETESAKKEKTASPAVVAGVPPPAPARENNYSVDGNDAIVSKQQTQSSAQNSVAQNQTANQATVMPDSRSVRNLPLNGRIAQSEQMKRRAESPAGSGAAKNDKDEDRKTETRTVSGRNFRRADGIWYDVKYSGQKTINVSRSSADYKKLDGNLRLIADNLGGVVVILWKEKAYRIQ